MVGELHFDLLVAWWRVFKGADVRVSAAALLEADSDDGEGGDG